MQTQKARPQRRAGYTETSWTRGLSGFFIQLVQVRETAINLMSG
ncbi:MAG TPA: hypothetical protein VGM64_09820 [Lacunisphaera sp.]